VARAVGGIDKKTTILEQFSEKWQVIAGHKIVARTDLEKRPLKRVSLY
jgi:hypothetical protein